MSPSSFKPYYQLTPARLLILSPEVITMATWVLPGAGPSMKSARAQPWLVLSLQVPGQTSIPGAISSQLTIWSLKSFLCFHLCLGLMFTSLGNKAKEIQGKMLCRGHFLIWKNLQEHVQDWLEITLLWLFFIVLRYMTVKLAGESGDSKLQTPAALQARSFGSLGKQKEKTSSEEDYIFHMLTLLEMDLLKFVSRL